MQDFEKLGAVAPTFPGGETDARRSSLHVADLIDPTERFREVSPCGQ